MTSPTPRSPAIDPSTGQVYAKVIPDVFATKAQVDAAITQALAGYQGGTAIPANLQQQLDAKATQSDLAGTFITIRWVGPSWPQRPATQRPIIWRGGPSSPPRTGSTAGGGGMAPDDIWLAAGTAVT